MICLFTESLYYNLVFWTGGRDAQTISQFVWNDNKQPVGPYVAFYAGADIQTCLAYNTDIIPDTPEYQSAPCTSLFGTLCQIG